MPWDLVSWEQLCLFCWGTGIDHENSYPAEGPTCYSMGEPPYIEPCICQYLPILRSRSEACPDCRGEGGCWRCDYEESQHSW